MTDTTTLAPPDPTTITGTGSVTIPAAGEHAVNDTINVRIVILAIAAIAMAIVICATIMTFGGWSVPDWMGTTAATSVGVLGGMLASTASKRT